MTLAADDTDAIRAAQDRIKHEATTDDVTGICQTCAGYGFVWREPGFNAILQHRLRPGLTLDVSCAARGGPVIGRLHWYVRDHAVLRLDRLADAFQCHDNTDLRL